jgi:hypothetical protein
MRGKICLPMAALSSGSAGGARFHARRCFYGPRIIEEYPAVILPEQRGLGGAIEFRCGAGSPV